MARQTSNAAEGARTVRESTLARVYQAAANLFTGRARSLTEAARLAGTTPRTIKRVSREQGGQFLEPARVVSKEGRHRTVGGYSIRPHTEGRIYTADGRDVGLVPLDLRNSSLLGAYWNAVDRAKAGEVDALRPFEHVTIYDLNGNPYRLLTDINTIYSLELAVVSTGGDAYFRRHYERPVGGRRVT